MATDMRVIESLGDLLNGNNVKVVVGDNGYAIILTVTNAVAAWASLRYGGDPNQAIWRN